MSTSPSTGQHVRRKKLNLNVKRQLQVWLLVRIVGIILLCTLVAVLVLYFYSRQELADSFWQAHIRIRRVSDLLLPVLITGAGVATAAGIVLALFLPQKIAGPLYRIEQDLKEVRAGDLTKVISLREDDILKELAMEINLTTEFFRGQTAAMQTRYREIENLVAGDPDRDQILAALQRLQSLLFALRS